MDFVKVEIDSIRVSLMSQQRIVILKDKQRDRYLPIWIGPCEADAITVELQKVEVTRPLTHDLLKSVIGQMGGKVEQIVVSDLRNDIFYARVIINLNGETLEIDSRPSDAIALAVRAKVPIYVAETVMEKASITPDEEIEAELEISTEEVDISDTESDEEGDGEIGEDRLDAFKDFLDTLDMDDMGEDE